MTQSPEALSSDPYGPEQWAADLAEAPLFLRQEFAMRWMADIPFAEDPGALTVCLLRRQIANAYDYVQSRTGIVDAADRGAVEERIELLSCLQNTNDERYAEAQKFGAELVGLVWKDAARDNADYVKVRQQELEKTALKERADHDPLTGLYGRSAWMNQVALRAEKREPLAILFIDMDRFKAVNDTLGHERGDELLKAFGRLLQTHSRTTDVVAYFKESEGSGFYHGTPDSLAGRMGGDEFAVALSIAPQDELNGADGMDKGRRRRRGLPPRERIRRYARRIMGQYEKFLHQEGNHDLAQLDLGLSVGASYWNGEGVFDLNDHMRGADQGMRDAKEANRRRWFFAQPETVRNEILQALRTLREHNVIVDTRQTGLPADLRLDE
ncbi:MAG TPA: GGDEF domain-containing protein [Candidatus Saccharimonadales bacterium]|nr:GGDEF domain-containing protein [Candidatus Saccharimonadales bacterium]